MDIAEKMDLPKRLREHDYEWSPQDAKALGVEAADEIERLRKELQSFREANMLLNSMIETEHKIIKTKGQ